MSHRILLVEESRAQALRFQLELLRYGLAVEVAGTGSAGLAAARATSPDAIVLDVDMPESDGFGICRALKADPSTAAIPVVILTHRDAGRETMKRLDVGAVDYIPKDAFAEHNLIESLRYLGIV